MSLLLLLRGEGAGQTGLSGVVGTTALGSLTVTVSKALTGVSATSALQSVIAPGAFGQTLTGVSATSALGSVTKGALTKQLSGVSTTGLIGSLSVFTPVPPVQPAVPPLELTIAGASKTYRRGTYRKTETVNGRNLLSLNVQSLDGTYRPAVNAEILLIRNGTTRVFGGFIDSVTEESVGREASVAIEHYVTAVDYNTLADRRYITLTLAAGTLKSQLTTLVTYLSQYGVTLHPLQSDGPPMPESFYEDARIDSILNDLTQISEGYVWSIDYEKQLRAILPGSVIAPFIINGDSIGDIQVESTQVESANFIKFYFGSGTQATTEFFTADGVGMSYQTQHRATKDIDDLWPFMVFYNGVAQAPVGWGPTQLPAGNWYWDYDTHTLVNGTGVPAPAGVVIPISYTIQYPIAITATTNPAPGDLIEAVYYREDILSATVAQAIADSLLARRATNERKCYYRTFTNGLIPGQLQTIVSSKRNISGSWIITDIEEHDSLETQFARDVTLVEGTVYRGSWRDDYSTNSGVGVVGSGSGGTVSPTGAAIASYFLGGSGLEAAQSPVPTWVPASGGGVIGQGAIQVRINTALRGITSAKITARLRLASSASVSVRARLYDVTTGVACPGGSDLVTSTTWTTVVFDVGLTAGIKDYELQLLPGAANQDVFGVGYLE